MKERNELLRALEVNRAVYDAVRDYIRPGVSEQDIYELTKTVVDDMLSDVPHEFIGDFVGGKRCGLIGGNPTEYKLSSGDGFILDLSVRCANTWSDTCRTFFLGEPTCEIKKAYDAVLKLQSFAASLVKPGICAEDIKINAEILLADMGYGSMMPHHMGHIIGAEPYMLSSALVGVVAQRLMRKVCPYCSRIEPLTESQIEFVGHDIPNARKAVGCGQCHGSGYLGRTAIHEVLVVDKQMRKLITAGAEAEEMKQYAIEHQNMKTLKKAAISLVEQGITTMEELERIAYYDD